MKNLVWKPCKYADFLTPSYREIESNLKLRTIFSWHSSSKHDYANRKFWEWCEISRALEESNMLKEGVSGLGFAVGTEPLASYFASRGCSILATDLHEEMSNKGWLDRNEHAGSLDKIYFGDFIKRVEFDTKVSFQPADMRTLDGINNKYDFLWSSCALEHLGSIQNGINFIENSLKLLKPGGVAVHTTEFNVSSNNKTIEHGENVIYRQKDLVQLSTSLEIKGYVIPKIEFDVGSDIADLNPDVPPYFESDKHHIKLKIGDYIATSFIMIIKKPLLFDDSNIVNELSSNQDKKGLWEKILRKFS